MSRENIALPHPKPLPARPPLQPLGQPQLLALELQDAVFNSTQLPKRAGYPYAVVLVNAQQVTVEGAVQGQAVSFANLRLRGE